MRLILLASVLISFALAVLSLPRWIRKCKRSDLLWEDMNKFEKTRNIAASGGIVVVMSFILGVLCYIALRTFIFNAIADGGINLLLFALINVILILSVVGLIDDLLGWKHGGLSARLRIFLAIFASVPLVVINAGTSLINIPFFGVINLGILYPLIIIPIGIAGATTTYNFLAGFNGLEAGQGIIILSFLSLIAYITGNPWLTIVGLCMVAPLLIFYYYNKYPAKIFPGDVLTYAIGALIAGMAILGNFERIAIFIFIPYIIETFLKIRGKLKKQSFGKPNPDNSLELPYEKIYGLTHLSIFLIKKFKKKVYEKEVVYLINLFQIILIILALIIFRGIIFA